MKAPALLIVALLGAVPIGGCGVANQAIEFNRETPAQRAARRAADRNGTAERAPADAAARVAALPAAGETLTPGQIYRGALPRPSGASGDPTLPAPATSVASGDAVPPSMQYLYGSGEAAAAGLQAYLALNDWMMSKATARQIGQPLSSVVLAPGASLEAPRFEPCGNKPLAVVLDVDETSLLNLGFEDDARGASGFDAARWAAWEQADGKAVAAVPGVLEAKAVADAVDVTFVFNSNRSAANAPGTAAALAAAGLGPVKHGETLWLQGDAGGGSGKDSRRAAIAAKYCVIAMVGDQLADFSDRFNAPALPVAARRALAGTKALKTLWGHGWFILPNPVYGTALRGTRDDVFPADKRWTPTQSEGAK